MQAPLTIRFWQYLRERFPLHQHGILIIAFSFSAISYSLITAGREGFIAPTAFTWAVISNLSLFFLLRVFDEFKDARDDAAYRAELPVPRGLISLKELGLIALVWMGLHALGTLLWFPSLIWLYLIVLAYMLLMRVEFFVPGWLKERPMAYALSHMMIIPLVDIFASGFDWNLSGQSAPVGMLFFFAVSFFNGMVLEVGRKIRPREEEREGVVTYSAVYGARKATWLWLSMLLITYLLCIASGLYASYPGVWVLAVTTPFLLAVWTAKRFLQNMTLQRARHIELVAGVWALLMYILLGAGPMIASFFD